MEKVMRRFLWGGTEMKRKMHLVEWKSVTVPKAVGGLGISNLEIQNGALLTKWLWRYGVESNSLWRQVIDAKLNINSNRLFPEVAQSRKTSSIWKNILQPLSISSKFYSLCTDMFAMSVGNGERISFWEDSWINGLILKTEFPRIYALASNKAGKVKEFGYWHDANWRWDVRLRRNVFGWEQQQWSNFSEILNGVHLHLSNDDKLIWKGNTNGNYSTSSFYKEASNSGNITNPLWKLVWSGYAPPKVEAFVWLVMRGRVAVKAEICRRGMINEEAALCTFCNQKTESVSHIFFHCFYSWSIWSWLLGEKNVAWCCPGEPFMVLLNWVNLVGNRCKEQWTMLFFTVVWSIWLHRNQMVFHDAHWDFIQLVNIIKYRFAHWCCAKWPRSGLTIENILRGYDEMLVGTQDKAVRTATMWSPPEEGSVKFNVDGSAVGKPGPAGIGGILRDPNGSTLAIFSKSIGCEDSNVAEFLAIIEAFKVFRRSRWLHLHLVVESDSRNAVLWACNPDEIPWRLRNLSNMLCTLKMGIDNWCCRHVYRETNVEADALAKQGVNREVDLEFFLS